VTDQLVPYIRPQENGGHADVRWLELRDAAGHGVRITCDLPRQVSVAHVPAAALDVATHDVEVQPVPEAIVHLDAAHRGVGTASCGPDTLERYKLRPGTHRWSWTLEPIEG
jgi:beta-galactosidase